jgi:hypothetical protein
MGKKRRSWGTTAEGRLPTGTDGPYGQEHGWEKSIVLGKSVAVCLPVAQGEWMWGGIRVLLGLHFIVLRRFCGSEGREQGLSAEPIQIWVGSAKIVPALQVKQPGI